MEHTKREYRNSYILQPPFPLRHGYFTYSPRLGTEALPESHTECIFFTIFYGQEIYPQGSLLCAFSRRSLCFSFSSSFQKEMPSNKIEQNLCYYDIEFWRPKISTALDSWHNLTTPEIKNKREGSQLLESLKMTTNLDCISKEVSGLHLRKSRSNAENYFNSSSPKCYKTSNIQKREKNYKTNHRDSQK